MTSLHERIATGGSQLGLCLMYPSPGVVERIGPDWDWLWIDGQHGELDYSDVLAMVRAANLIQRPALVRVAGHDFGEIGRALDTGTDGVIVPCVDTLAQAQQAVDAAKFPPMGKRSYGGRRPIDFHGRGYADTANTEIVLAVQIESPEAVANADSIAALPGVDALFLGPDDLKLRRGHDMIQPNSRELLGDDMAIVTAACRKHGKLAITVGFGTDMLKLCAEFGFDLIVAGGDVPFLANTSRQMSQEARTILHNFDTHHKPGAADKTTENRSNGKVVGSPY